MPSTKLVHSIYTDGACSGNPGPGGWGTVVYFADGSVHELGGAAPQTTNNRMELQAAIAGLDYLLTLNQTEPVTLYTDSEYVKNGITQWVKGWKQKGWKTSAGKPVLNQDLWQLLDQLHHRALHQGTTLQWKYVRGHAGNEGNERCDTIARAFSGGRKPSLKQVFPATPKESDSEAHSTDEQQMETVQSSPDPMQASPPVRSDPDPVMVDSPNSTHADVSDLPREVRVLHLRGLLETLHIADEIARQGYLITSSELADLMDVNASAVTSRGNNWVWRNWVVSRVRREGNQILWQLERID